MTTNLIKKTQRKAAKIAGIVYPISMIIVMVVTYAFVVPNIVKDNLPETARNILSHEFSFRIGMTGYILFSVLTIILLVSLYAIQKHVNKSLALFAAICRLINGITWLLIALNQYLILRLLRDVDLSQAFHQEEIYAMMKFHLDIGGQEIYYLGLLFWGLASTVASYLWFKSRYIPKFLAIIGIGASAWCILCTSIYYIYPNFAGLVSLTWFDVPMVLFEFALSFWLLFKGLRLSDEMGNK